MKKRSLISILLFFVIMAGFVLSKDVPAYAMEGYGTEQSPYLIKTEQDLFKIPSNSKAYYRLTNDIDVKNVRNASMDNFNGVLDGDNYTIKNFKIVDGTNVENIGLFATAYDATFMNLHFENASLTSTNNCAGLLVGSATKSNFKNCSFNNISINGFSYTGTLYGFGEDITIENCKVKNIEMKTTSSETGGLAGLSKNTDIKNSYVLNGTITSNSSTGGLIGSLINSKVYQCYSTVDIIATGMHVGGITGCTRDSELQECYSLGTLKGTNMVGGINGVSFSTTSFENCYFIGILSAHQSNSRIYGISSNESNINNCYASFDGTGESKYGISNADSVTNSYFDETVSKITTPEEQARATDIMYTRSNYSWDFDTVWIMNEGDDYPRLRLRSNQIEPPQLKKRLKLVLEPAEVLQLSTDANVSSNTTLTWSSSDPTVARVSSNGVLHAIKNGDAAITVTDTDGIYKETLFVFVTDNAIGFRMGVDLRIGASCRLTVDNANNMVPVTWVSNETSKATVSNKGLISAVSTGLVLIRALETDTSEIGHIYVRVK